MNIGLLTPNNWSHKAEDGIKTRKYYLKKDYHPTLQAKVGSTQLSYVLLFAKENITEYISKKIN